MTLEELRREARNHGYYLMKPTPNYTKLLPCTCGHKHRTELIKDNKFAYECKTCGKRSEFAYTREMARKEWNKMIERETDDGR